MSELIDRILDEFKDINYAYNDSTRLDTLSRMLGELVKQAASPWRRVEEPPKENGRYLVSWEGAVTTDEYKNGVWLYASMFNLRVTHWMPIEPPREE